MTERTLRRLVEQWQHRLELDAWELELEFCSYESPDGYAASVDPSPHRDIAVVRFYEWENWTIREATHYVVHELLHIAHRDVANSFDLFEGVLSADADRIAAAAIDHAIEVFIDRQARILCNLAV